MRYAIRLAVVVFFSAFAGLAIANAEKRVALVIGNAKYQHIAGLPNVPNDAKAMAALFKGAKFDSVVALQNKGVAELRKELLEFAERAAEADVAVVFYAGHGIEMDGINYLIPVDARLRNDLAVKDETVSLERVLELMGPARKLRMVIIDACRENPFAKSMKLTTPTRTVTRGLGRVEASGVNTLIAFATEPSAVAEDGSGMNSPFTAALLKHLATPGLDLRIALGNVRDEVMASTGKKQRPYVTSSLGGGVISLASAALVAPKPGVASTDIKDGSRPSRYSVVHAGGLFGEQDAKRLQSLADKHRFPLPDFQIELPDADVPASLRRFVGIWADTAGRARNVRDNLLIVTRVDKDGRADGYLVYGPPGSKSWTQGSASAFKIAGTITDMILRFSSPSGRYKYTAKLTSGGRMNFHETSPKGEIYPRLYVPVWSLVQAEGIAKQPAGK